MQVERTPHETEFLDRMLRWLGVALVIAIVGFAAYYVADRRANPGPPLVDRAVQQAEDAVRTNPSNASARLTLGDLYLAKDRPTDAIAQYNAALKIDDKLWRAHRGLGLAYLGQHDFPKAEGEFQKVIDAKKDTEFAAVDKGLEEAYYFMAQAQIGLKQPQKATDDLEKALKIDNTDADAWLLLGSTDLSIDKPKDAIDALKRAVLFVPKFPEAYQTLAQAYQATGNLPGVQYAQAMVFFSRGENDQAIAQLQAVTRATPDFWDAWTGLGLAYEAKLDKQNAAAAYRRALKGNPNDFNAHAGLARLGQPQP